MEDINKIIESYEPMMHTLLKRFKVKKDYEDILQLLRIKTWEILRDEKYDKYYKNKDGVMTNAKLSTFLYVTLRKRLQNILRVDYRIKVKDDGVDIDTLPISKKMPYFIENPEYYLDLPSSKQLDVANDADTATLIRYKLDFEVFCNSLSKKDKELLKLMIQGFSKEEIAKKRKCTKRNINIRLAALKKEFKKYLIEGGI
jgi:RNA polymerase sigma factor (sigma-70 family)